MPTVIIDNVEIQNWLDIGEISDSLSPSGSAFTIEIMGYPPTNKLGAVRVEVYDDQGELAAIGTGIPSIQCSLRPRTTYNVSSFYSQLQRKKIVGQYNSTLITILRQLIIDGSADMYFTSLTFRTAYDTPDLIVNQYIDYQFLKDALSLVLLGAGRQLSYKIPINDTTIEIIEPGYAPNAPVATLSIDSLYTCSHLGIKSINYNKINPLASVIRVFGRNGHNIDSSGKTILNPDILRYRAQDGRTQYPTQQTCDEILFIRITPAENVSCLVATWNASGIFTQVTGTPTGKGFDINAADLSNSAVGEFITTLTLPSTPQIWRGILSFAIASADTSPPLGSIDCYVNNVLVPGYVFPISESYGGTDVEGDELFSNFNLMVDLSAYVNTEVELKYIYNNSTYSCPSGATGSVLMRFVRICNAPEDQFPPPETLFASTAGVNPATANFTLNNPSNNLAEYFGFVFSASNAGGEDPAEGITTLKINGVLHTTVNGSTKSIFIPLDESLRGTTISAELECSLTGTLTQLSASIFCFYG